MKLIYIAGRLNDDACGYIKNLHRMIDYDVRIKRLGFATFCPGLDILEGLHAGNFEYEDYFLPSQEILRRCDAIFLVPGWTESKGVAKELILAKEYNIPVFANIDELLAWREEQEKLE